MRRHSLRLFAGLAATFFSAFVPFVSAQSAGTTPDRLLSITWPASLMPQGITRFLTRSELIDLIRFVGELGKPGPYALRSTPVIACYC